MYKIPDTEELPIKCYNNYSDSFYDKIITKNIDNNLRSRFSRCIHIQKLLLESKIFKCQIEKYIRSRGFSCKWKKIHYKRIYNKHPDKCDFDENNIGRVL